MKQRKPSLIIGRQPLVEAIRTGQAIERIFLLRNASGEIIHIIRQLARENNIPINMVPVEKLNSLSKNNHQGCIAIGGTINYLDLQDVISFVQERGETPLFLMLDGITDVRNIGAIARSALCCGAQALIIPDKGIAPLNEDAVKASAGALEQINVCRAGSLLKAADTLHLNGIKIAAADMKAGKKVFECDLKDPLAVIIGAEDTGIYPALLKSADELFRIPMAGDFDSFNVSVATGIILYETMRQRGGSSYEL